MAHVAHVSFSHAGISGSEEEFHSLGFYRMTARNLATGMIFLLQTTVGSLGNFSVLYQYLFLHLTGCKLRPTDLILKHLTVANLLVILSKGIPQMMAALGLKHFLNDIGCKVVFYVHRAGRDVSMGTTCLLSVLQAVTISPRDARWAQLKAKALRDMGTSAILCWILNMLLNILVPFHMTDQRKYINLTKKIDLAYCSTEFYGRITQSLYVSLVSFHDGFCLVLMLWASGSMVLILLRHKRRVQHIHKNNLRPRSSPETTATQSILALVSVFVSLWTLSFVFHICLTVLKNPSWWLIHTSMLVTAGFPTVSPYVLMSRDPRVSGCCFAGSGTQNPLTSS